MANEIRLCPACLTDLNIYQNPTTDDAIVVREFREQYSLKSVFDLAGPIHIMLGHIEHALEAEPVRVYFSKLESLAKSQKAVPPVNILPELERHPLVCSAFPIPRTMFALHVQCTEEQVDEAASSYEISLLGIKVQNDTLIGTHKFITVRAFNLLGTKINHP